MKAEREVELEIEVFREGDYGDKGVYTREDLERVAASYDAKLHEAPVTFDHAQSGPAHGWVAGVKVAGDRLVARLRQISPVLAAALRSGAFRKRSVELFRRFTSTGGPYLKAVSFLGAATPRVAGLSDPMFADDADDTVVFTSTLVTQPATNEEREHFRTRLVEGGVWNPRWEDEGLFDVFSAIGPSERENLTRILEMGPAMPTPGVQQRIDTAETVNFAASLCGIEHPDSADEHLGALRRMAADPSIDYRTALLAASRG